MAPRMRRTTGVAAALLVAGVLAGCTPDGQTPPVTTTTASAGPSQVTLAVYGPDPVISAYTTIAARFSADHPAISVNVRPYPDHEAAMAALRQEVGTPRAPDIFVSGESDLDWLRAAKATQKVDDMLSDRNIDFGDGYERVGLEAFSADSALQCMPVDVSPLVVYYNARLVHLAKIRKPGQKPPNSDDGWRMSDFVTAAQQASTGRTRGVYVAPDLDQIAPFVFSGGGQVVDDLQQPTRLDLSSGASEDAMRQLLQVVRNPQLTFTSKQLAKRDAVARFKAGQLGMILGHRALTPELRQQEGLIFGVMPMPRLAKSATTGDVSAFCVSPDLDNKSAVADVLAYLVDTQASKLLAATGYVTPANLDALFSEAFTQPTEDPIGSGVFASQLRFVRDLPDNEPWDRVREASRVLLSRLFYDPVIDPLDERLQAIDDASQLLLSPSPSPSPSGTSSESPGASPTG